MSNDDIVICMVNQMHELDWYSEVIMTRWEETNNNSKTWKQGQQFFKEAYIARIRYIEAKGSTQESINKVVMNEWHLYIKAIEPKAMQDKKGQEEHIQQVTQENATLINIIHEQQNKIEEMMVTS